MKRFVPLAIAFAMISVSQYASVSIRSVAEPVSTVPKASCGPNDHPETGLQGQVPLVDRLSGRSLLEGYTCNLELVGQYVGQGSSFGYTWYGDCVYMGHGDEFIPPSSGAPLGGVDVVDFADPANPRYVKTLNTPGMQNAWESLEAHQGRGLLVADGISLPFLDVYDVSGDCTNPVLKSAYSVPEGDGHAGGFSADGTIFYTTAQAAPMAAVDITDPAHPQTLFSDYRPGGSPHEIVVSDDGTRGYVMIFGGDPSGQTSSSGGFVTARGSGVTILDLTDVHNRVPGAKPSVISKVGWGDGSGGQEAIFARINGHPYLIASDELPTLGLGPEGARRACAEGLPPFGFVRMIDVEDETQPEVVSKIMLEVHDPANCAQTQVTTGMFGSSAHYCAVDDRQNATALACGFWEGGLRVFDIRDPLHPKEIAYYNPPGKPGTRPFMSPTFRCDGCTTNDEAISKPRWKQAADGTWHVWFASFLNGAQVVRFTNDVYPLTD